MNKHFDVVYWITLRERKDRQRKFGRNLAELGTQPMHRIFGVDARKLAITTDSTADVICLNDGYIGTYLTHLYLMKLIGTMPTGSRALVLEDDALLSENFVERLNETMKGIPGDWEMVHLGGLKDSGMFQDGCWAYLITKEGAAKMERILEERRRHLDDMFKYVRDRRLIRFYHTVNPIVTEDVGGSDTRSPLERERGEVLRGDPQRSYSQYGEDIIVEKFFEGVKGGRFLEIGALDGIKDSNCRRLALKGWSGVSIEANPYLFCRLNSNYGNSAKVITLCALVMASRQIRTFHLNPDGLSTTDPNVFKDLHQRVHYNGYCHMPSVTPDDLKQLYGANFDFVSVDAEGVDTEIVRASKELLAGTKLLCIETDRPARGPDEAYQKEWKDVLTTVGFTKVVHKSQGNTLLTRS
jgi:FkbM family methyltransferase